jgi:hypothetical protein
MPAFFGGVPEQIVSDNPKASVTRACFHAPRINRTGADMAAHHGTAVIPARPYKPRDKAKAEVGVLLIERWIVARLRKRRFFALAELNAAIRELLAGLNAKVTRHLGTSRRELFGTPERMCRNAHASRKPPDQAAEGGAGAKTGVIIRICCFVLSRLQGHPLAGASKISTRSASSHGEHPLGLHTLPTLCIVRIRPQLRKNDRDGG